jgi:hypothetical protein
LEDRCQWLIPVILATQEAEIRRIKVESQPRQIVNETLSLKTLHKKKKKKKNRDGRVAQCESPKLKPQNRKKKKERKNLERQNVKM